jgi:hypothetical protein
MLEKWKCLSKEWKAKFLLENSKMYPKTFNFWSTRLRTEQLTPPILRGSRCLVRFQVGPLQNQALTSKLLWVPFSFAHNFHKKTKHWATWLPRSFGAVGAWFDYKWAHKESPSEEILKGIFVFLSRQDSEAQSWTPLAALLICVNLTFLENFSNNYSQKGLPTAAGRRKELTPWRLCGLPAAGHSRQAKR